jgi:hypothetical protein
MREERHRHQEGEPGEVDVEEREDDQQRESEHRLEDRSHVGRPVLEDLVDDDLALVAQQVLADVGLRERRQQTHRRAAGVRPARRRTG